jgi:hypothetical protein
MWTWSSSKSARASATVAVGRIVFGAVTITSFAVRPVSGGSAAGTSWMIAVTFLRRVPTRYGPDTLLLSLPCSCRTKTPRDDVCLPTPARLIIVAPIGV